MSAQIRLLGPRDLGVLRNVAPEVFDRPVVPHLAQECLNDPKFHLVVAIDDGVVVGFASALHYSHPDKPVELYVNEIGVTPSHRRHGLGARLLGALFDEGRRLDCRTAWLATNRSNQPAMMLFEALGGDEGDSDTKLYEFDLSDSRPRS